MIDIVNLGDCPLSRKNGTYGGAAGNKEGILFKGELWLVKYPKNIRGLQNTGGASYSTAPLSEYEGICERFWEQAIVDIYIIIERSCTCYRCVPDWRICWNPTGREHKISKAEIFSRI